MHLREIKNTEILDNLFLGLDPTASILDVGCLNFCQYYTSQRLKLAKHKHSGVDYALPSEGIPPGYVFKNADLNITRIPFEDDSFDLVVASHIIEHIAKPVDFFGDCIRVCKPGGLVYIEAPSERSLLLPGMPFDHHKFLSTSFFDDPTHTFRPWSPQAFYRLTKYFHCEPIKTEYYYSLKVRLLFPMLIAYAALTRDSRRFQNWCWRAFGWACFIIIRKPKDIKGMPSFNYFIPDMME